MIQAHRNETRQGKCEQKPELQSKRLVEVAPDEEKPETVCDRNSVNIQDIPRYISWEPHTYLANTDSSLLSLLLSPSYHLVVIVST